MSLNPRRVNGRGGRRSGPRTAVVVVAVVMVVANEGKKQDLSLVRFHQIHCESNKSSHRSQQQQQQ